jgi:hypothetical protein
MSITLKPYLQKPSEFHLFKGNKPTPPGIKYNIDGEVIKNLNMPEEIVGGEDWKLQDQQFDAENLLRLTPHTQKRKDFELLFSIRRDNVDGSWLKGVLKNKITGKYALISSMCSRSAESYQCSKGKSMDNDWSVCWAKMIAPWMFWNELKKRID